MDPDSKATPYIITSSIDQEAEHICIIVSSKKIQWQILSKPNKKMLIISHLTHDLRSDGLLVGIVQTPDNSHEFSLICVALVIAENSRTASEMLAWT